MTWSARSSGVPLAVGVRLTLIPALPSPGVPAPVPAGLVVETNGTAGFGERLRVVEAIPPDGPTHELLVARDDGRLFRLTPQRPSEGGGYYEPGRGMSVWVVRWQVEG